MVFIYFDRKPVWLWMDYSFAQIETTVRMYEYSLDDFGKFNLQDVLLTKRPHKGLCSTIHEVITITQQSKYYKPNLS